MNDTPDTEKNTVLIVDDENDLRDLLCQLLNGKGYNVLSASNGVEALEHIRDRLPNIIVTDVNMPELGGKELYKKMLNNEGKPKCPFLFLAAQGELSDFFTEDIEDVGFIGKPFLLPDILAKVADMIKN